MLFQPQERAFAEHLSRFAFLNPFFHAETKRSYEALVSADPGDSSEAWPSSFPERPWTTLRPWVPTMVRRMVRLLDTVRERLIQGGCDATPDDVRLYDDLLIFTLFYPFQREFQTIAENGGRGAGAVYRPFLEMHRHYLNVPLAVEEKYVNPPAHVFACLVQTQWAYALIESLLRGNSLATARLRASVWNSIFPHEQRLYGQLLFNRMHDVTTLVLGPSGTGKELVAAAIGLARYIPFDDKKQQFTEPFGGSFHAVNLSALPRDLIESEIFGHCAGAFTGAVKDRVGWFEQCRPHHTVFLDEIGELEESVQVKLLRVLQSRQFHRVGETESRQFHGKVIAATNRNISAEIASGRFRQDLYYRLCSDVVQTPSLREQLDDCPDDLPLLVRLVSQKCLGESAAPQHLEWLANLTTDWIQHSPQLGPGYAWPGNFRELEQCVRNVMVRGEYHPLPVTYPASAPAASTRTSLADPLADPLEALAASVRGSSLTFDELLEQYCSLVFARSGNVAEAARKLGKHRATIQARIRPELVEKYRQ